MPDNPDNPKSFDKPNLFVYGTLVHELTLSAVLRRTGNLPKYHPARLDGYQKVGLNILENPEAWIQGYVMKNISVSDMFSFDSYEHVGDGLYHKIQVRPVLLDGTEIDCIAYQLV
jgi:hypothetical protein